jgi:hypothetical protein
MDVWCSSFVISVLLVVYLKSLIAQIAVGVVGEIALSGGTSNLKQYRSGAPPDPCQIAIAGSRLTGGWHID